MSKHWTITIQVHEVTPPEPIREGNGYTTKVNLGGGLTSVAVTPRDVAERFNVTVRADDETEAYSKALALLEVNRPEPTVRAAEVPEFTTRPIRDNPQA